MNYPLSTAIVLSLASFVINTTSTAAVTGTSASSVVGQQSIKRDMKKMKIAYRAAVNASTISEFASQFNQLKALTDSAKLKAYKGSANEQAIYKKGFNQLSADFVLIDKAIAQGNLAAAKQALQKVKLTEKSYHNQLNV